MTFSSCRDPAPLANRAVSFLTLADEQRTMKIVYITPKSTRSIRTSCTASPVLPKWRLRSLRCSLSKARQLGVGCSAALPREPRNEMVDAPRLVRNHRRRPHVRRCAPRERERVRDRVMLYQDLDGRREMMVVKSNEHRAPRCEDACTRARDERKAIRTTAVWKHKREPETTHRLTRAPKIALQQSSTGESPTQRTPSSRPQRRPG